MLSSVDVQCCIQYCNAVKGAEMLATIEPRYMETSDAARALGVAVTTLRKWEQNGTLAPSIRTMGGRRLFRLEEVEELRARRQAQQEGSPPLEAA